MGDPMDIRNLTVRYVWLQTFERVERMCAILNSDHRSTRNAERQVIETFRLRLEEVRGTLFSALASLGSVDAEMDDALCGSFLRLTSASMADVHHMHRHLSLIDSRWTPPEAYAFVHALFSPLQSHAVHRLSVVPSDTYMFEQAHLSALLNSATARNAPSAPTLFIPKIEAANPLQWGTLVHEMGHAFSSHVDEFLDRCFVENTKLLPSITRERPQHSRVVRNWTNELFCDLLATFLLGPAYIASFVDFSLVAAPASQDPFGSSHSHPAAQWRLSLIWDTLKDTATDAHVGLTSELGQCWPDLGTFMREIFATRVELDKKYLGGSSNRAPIDARVLKEEIVTHLPSLVRAIGAEAPRLARVRYLRERLDRKVPIATVSLFEQSQSREEARQRVVKFQESLRFRPADADASRGELVDLLAGVRETPCSVAEIVCAGWLHKIEAIYLPQLARLEAFTPESGSELFRSLLQVDALIRTSVETSYLSTLLSPPDES